MLYTLLEDCVNRLPYSHITGHPSYVVILPLVELVFSVFLSPANSSDFVAVCQGRMDKRPSQMPCGTKYLIECLVDCLHSKPRVEK